MEVHFYYDIYSLQEKAFPIYYTHKSTIDNIDNNEFNVIHSTAISAVNYAWDKGCKIFLHENNRFFEIHEGITEGTDKELRKGHNIERIWISGIFKDYFYG